MLVANSNIFSWKLFETAAPPGTFIARTHLFLNGRNSHLLKKSDKSTIFNGFLKSGLSEPYVNMASSNVILVKGGLETVPLPKVLNTSYRTVSATSKTSSCVAKDNSKSN